MAVTLQLARGPVSLIERCRTDSRTRDQLLSRDRQAGAAYMDFEWFPTVVGRMLPALELPESERGSILLAVSGEELLVPESEYDVYSDVRMTTPSSVNRISGALDRSGFCRAVSERISGGLDTAIYGDLMDPVQPPAQLLCAAFARLTAFYREAARDGHAVACWWD